MHIETQHGTLRNTCALICCEINNNLKNILISVLCICITACGGGGGGSNDDTNTLQQLQLSGSVGDGPVTDATITVTDSNGGIIASTLSDDLASYTINIPGDSIFPVTITATGGTDLVTGDRPDFTMVSSVTDKQDLDNNKLVANINPFSTFMVKMTQTMQGGLNRTNLNTAKKILQQKFNFGLDTEALPDPIHSKITVSNIASIVKASEAMGEMIRRTRDALISSGSLTNGNEVVDALSSDIADGKIDGAGKNADAKFTATAKITSAQVLIEVLGNRLKVKNANATALMDNAIKVTKPEATMNTSNVRLTTELINQTRESLATVQRYNTSIELTNIETIIATLNDNSYPSDVNNVLPIDAENSLQDSINSIAQATNDEINTINEGPNTGNSLAASPIITTVANGTAQEGVLYRYDVNATDNNSDDILTYALTSAPSSMAINSSTGLITWTPSSTQIGTHNVTIRVSDNASPVLSTTQSYIVKVAAAPVINVAPVISSLAVTTSQVEASYRYDVDADDVNPGDTLIYSLSTAPSGMLINASNGIITWSPTSNQAGSHEVVVDVSDNATPALSVTQSFSVQVAPKPVENVAPAITTTAITAAQIATAYSYNVNAIDNNTSDTLSYALTTSPNGMTINASSGFISWTPSNSQAGTHNVSVVVSDNASPALSSTQNFTIEVTPIPVINVKPVITSSAISMAQVGTAYRYDVDATDENSGDILSYLLESAPSGMTINSNNGVITWTPSESQLGTQDVIVKVLDNASPQLSDTSAFSIQVASAPVVNVRPIFTSTPITTATTRKTYQYDVNATDENTADVLSYTLISAPNGMSIDANSGAISWVPSDSQVGVHNVSVRVDDNQSPAMSALHDFSITVSGIVIRINAGGGEFLDSKGQNWSADYGYNLGEKHSVVNPIDNTVDDTLYQSERWHSTFTDSTSPELEYSINVPNGKYIVGLHFAEISGVTRVFDIKLEGSLTIDNFNIADEIGRNIATVKNFAVTITDGQLNIQLPRNTQSPKISAIEIFSAATHTNASTSSSGPVSIQAPETNTSTGTLTIVGGPSSGTVSVNSGTFSYVPNNGFSGLDTFVYSFTDANNVVTLSSVTVDVTCVTCSSDPKIVLSWEPNADPVTGYRVYYGPDSVNATELKSDITVASGLLDPTAPAVEYAAIKDLNFYTGEQICFKVQAYTDNEVSELSEAICGTI